MAEEADWIELSRKGSAEAFSQLVLLHQARVRGYIGRYLRQKDMVDDLAQEVFLAAYRRMDTYEGKVPLSLWLLGIARNCVLEHWRGEGRRRAREMGRVQAELSERRFQRLEEEALADQAREMGALHDCIRKLPAGSARLISEYYFESRTTVDIAHDRGGREGTIRMALMRIRQMLRECMDRKLPAEGTA